MFAASTGARVLLIEGDLRRPTFHRLMPVIGGMPGLEAYLRGEAEWPEIVDAGAAPDLPGLHVVQAGRSVADSTELLSSGRLARLLDRAKAEYELVIVDSPPCQQLMDARIIGTCVDGIIYAVRWGTSHPEAVRSGLRSLTDLGGKVLGVVLGMVEFRQYARYDHTAGPGLREYLPAIERDRS
jgi:capsular exopolysaccharide synthesis family protein